MSSTMYIAVSGAIARLRDLDVVANNLANADTTGFKRDRTVFESALESRLLDAEGRELRGEAARSFAAPAEVAVDLGPGATERTGSPLHAAIDGEGFFEIETPRGLRYTRAGAFAVNVQGELVTHDGHPVLGADGRIALGSADVKIEPDGSIVDSQGQSRGRLRLVSFDEPGLLVKEGANLLRAEPGAAANDVLDPLLLAGSLEKSNVQAVEELGALVMLQRAFEINIQAMRAADEATSNLLREFNG